VERVKAKFLDLLAHNIDYVRYMVGTHNWSEFLACTDIQRVYDTFLTDLHKLIDVCVPVKYVTVGPRDPPYVTPSSNLCW